jgi:hypothetical protein
VQPGFCGSHCAAVALSISLFSSVTLAHTLFSLSGEGDPIKKNVDEDPWIRSGTQVRQWVEGVRACCITCIGSSTSSGNTYYQ